MSVGTTDHTMSDGGACQSQKRTPRKHNTSLPHNDVVILQYI